MSGKSIPVIPSDSRDPILLSILPFPVGQQKGRRRCPVAMEQICDLEEGIIVSGGAAVPYLDFRFSNRRRGKENPQEVFSAREALRVFQESRQGKVKTVADSSALTPCVQKKCCLAKLQ